MTRITKLDGEFGSERSDSRITAEFDVDPSAWFFQANGSGVMPLAVLMEIALQPCGWLGSFTGIPLRADSDLYFRNLDGTAEVGAAVLRESGVVRTEATLTSVARSGGISLTSFEVRCEWNGNIVFRMQTSFGFFRKETLARQTGLSRTAVGERADTVQIDLTSRPSRYFEGPLRMPSGDLLMLDRVTGVQETGSQRAWVRAEKDVRPSEWFFKAHFYQDPVQPGSLGLEALVQTLQFYVIHAGLADGIADPVSILDGPLVWKYRGQVFPVNRRVVVEVEVKQTERTADGFVIRAEGWLSVDGLPIYHFSDFGQKVVSRRL